MDIKWMPNDVELKIDISSEISFKEGIRNLITQMNFVRMLRNDIEIHLKSMEETYKKAVFNYSVPYNNKLENSKGEKITIFKNYIPSKLNRDNYIVTDDEGMSNMHIEDIKYPKNGK